MHGTNTAALAIKNCDLFVAVGTRFSDRVLCNAGLFARHCPIIQIDIDTAEFNKNIDVQLKMKGDAKAILEKLNSLLSQHNHREWMDSIAAWKQEYPLLQKGEAAEDVLPQEVLETLARLTEDGAVITTDVGQHQMWQPSIILSAAPGSSFLPAGWGLWAMAWAPPSVRRLPPGKACDQRGGGWKFPYELH